MSKPEAIFQAKLLKELRSHAALKPGVVLKLNADATTKGIPDVMISVNGVTTFFELKCEPNEASKIQVYYLRRLAPRAYIAEKRRTPDEYVLYQVGERATLVSCFAHGVEKLAEEIVIRCVNA